MTVSVVYQGPTSYFDKLAIANHRLSDDIIFSTWEDEPQQNINILLDKGYKVILNKKPQDYGFHNINLQTNSTISGINNSKNDFILKIRSDMLIDDMDKFLNLLLKKEKMTFLCYHQHSSGYVCDYINYGRRSDMMLWWDYSQTRLNQKPPEVQLLDNYFFVNSLPNELKKFPNIKEIFNFFLLDLSKEQVKINWLKNKIYLNSYISDSLFLY